MKPSESASAFKKFAEFNGVALFDCTPREGLAQMFSFYQSVFPEGCYGPDRDMLLFQWGIYDWGSGRHFEFNITRQFIEQESEGDDAISQLRFTFKFEPTAERENLGSGNRWCESPAELEILRELVSSSPSFVEVADQRAIAVELTHSYD